MKKLIAYCGLDCEKCDARIATVTNDNALREATASKWNGLNEISVIKPEHINCMGCRMDGVKTVYCGEMCEIRKCVVAKGYETCGNCAELDTCALISPVLQNTPGARENLRGR